MAEEVESTVAELAKERGLIKAVLKSMSEAVIALDDERHITLMNPAAVELLGLTSVPEGRSILEVLRVPAAQQLVGDEPVVGPRSAEFELPNNRHVLARLRPQRGAEGSVLVMLDVTDVRRLETVRRDFVANVSHELRTPVAIIRANAETLLEGALDDPKFGRSLIDALHRNAERLSNIISDLLDLSRVEAGRYYMELEPVKLDEIADNAAKSIERSAAERGITIDVEVPADAGALADFKALEQVLFNLLDNAVKYTPEGGRIKITSAETASGVQVCVEDNGPGIEPRHRERVFERFYRVDPGRSRNMGGTGLGLAIVRHLVEAMRGRVSVRGAQPHGSIFAIDLPAVDDDSRERPGTGTGTSPEPITEEVVIRAPRAVRAEREASPGSRARAPTHGAGELDRSRRPGSGPGDVQAASDGEADSESAMVRDNLLKMTGYVEQMIGDSVKALLEHDGELARRTIARDQQVNRLEVETDDLCMLILARRQPVESDLRFITLAMKMVTDLERIGDLAVNIGERALALDQPTSPAISDTILDMGVLVKKMLHKAIDAFVNGNTSEAETVWKEDEDVDSSYIRLSNVLQANMQKSAEWVERGIHLQAVAKFLERIGDHCTNLAEQVVFMVQGKDPRHPGIRQ